MQVRLFRSAGAVSLAVLLLGCGGCVTREDRSINYSADGKQVAFQNGQEGVFVAEREGEARQIYKPGPEVLAVSPPLWSPTDGRLIFTTAEAADPASRRGNGSRQEPDPVGNLHWRQPVIYSCWLRPQAAEGGGAAPTLLFRARVDDVGYVAAGLAVRWHPDGKSLVYLDQTEPGKHGLFRWEDGDRRRVFPHDSAALVFDFCPDKVHLTCVRRVGDGRSADDGIWIGDPEAGDWWRVPGSEDLPAAELPSLPEQLRAGRPAWSPAGDRFTFVSQVEPPAQDRPGRQALRVSTLAARTLRTLAEGPGPFLDLHWSPDGSRVGVLDAGKGSLCLVTPDGGGLHVLDTRPVRRFAGWDVRGKHLAYTVPERVPHADAAWALLLVHDPLARDVVYLAPGAGGEAGRPVFSGMRVTFPQWAPDRPQLSLWATFTPTWRSRLAELQSTGLRPGDPAAVLDPETGTLRWKQVNPGEKVQVGHYHLLKRNLTEAWRWYQEAAQEAPTAEPATLEQALLHLGDPGEATFFEYLCLRRLGRDAEARAKLARFERAFQLPAAGQGTGEPGASGQPLVGLTTPALVRDLYAAEVFLSLDAAEEGERWFRERLSASDSDLDRLSRALVLGQLLLVQKKHAENADLTAGEIVPLLLHVWQPAPGPFRPRSHPQGLLLTVATVALLPLSSPEFLAELPDNRVRALAERWEQLAGQAGDDVTRLEVDLLREGAAARLGQSAARQVLARRVEENTARAELLAGRSAADALKLLRQRDAAALRSLRGQGAR